MQSEQDDEAHLERHGAERAAALSDEHRRRPAQTGYGLEPACLGLPPLILPVSVLSGSLADHDSTERAEGQ